MNVKPGLTVAAMWADDVVVGSTGLHDAASQTKGSYDMNKDELEVMREKLGATVDVLYAATKMTEAAIVLVDRGLSVDGVVAAISALTAQALTTMPTADAP